MDRPTISGALRGETPPSPLMPLGGAGGAAARKAELGILVLIGLFIVFGFLNVFGLVIGNVIIGAGDRP